MACLAGPHVIHSHPDRVRMNGAVGENRTHDLSLTKGLRYHYATTATVVFFSPFKAEAPHLASIAGAKGALL